LEKKLDRNNIKTVSIVSPVYNAELTLKQLCLEIVDVFKGLDLFVEIILVDDGSQDGSWEVIEKIVTTDDHKSIRGIRLSRNFGQHYAIKAGIDYAKGDLLIAT
jgi:glycosyltransferase involved in cell wall biosynthesis